MKIPIIHPAIPLSVKNTDVRTANADSRKMSRNVIVKLVRDRNLLFSSSAPGIISVSRNETNLSRA